MKLYGYFRSSAAFRVRIALALKGLDHESVYIHLAKGEQFAPDYAALNPEQQVPTLVDDGHVLVQSPAILEYLEETHPEPALLPKDPVARARVRAIAMAVGCDMHPLNNLRVLKYITGEMGLSDAEMRTWYAHWIARGFTGIEAMLAGSPETGRFCHGDAPTFADIYLVPQVFNAQRFDCPLDAYPTLMRVHEACMALDAFDQAQPAKQPDAA
ncbi:MAG: maleylacetoacetate isomerase [Alphaproteobacteria bacterium]|nr:maleylacetoacetate isomerase [Alphaproteobacteria bacterium]